MAHSKDLQARSKFNADKYFHAKVTIHCQYDRIVKIIKDKLNEEASVKFQETCFGNLVYNAANLQLCSQMLHQILLRQADFGSADEMWFNICGTTTRFGPQEFCFLTGLRMGNVAEKFNDISAKDEQPHLLNVIQTEGKLTQAALIDFFKSCSIEDVSDIVSLALLTFLHGVLIPGDGKSLVDNRFLYLCEDMNAWNAFPWGSLSYNKTIEFLGRAVPRGLLQKGKSMKTYALGGFPFAFQVIY